MSNKEYKIGDIVIGLKTGTFYEIKTRVSPYENNKTFFRKATDRERFLYYLGVRSLDEEV